ncbi:MAG: 30S ribosomal protein S4 [Candidatus Delongbacteria bacterium]|nr:30S ribosomal protein S4 [Candidatus Delongbacteria bacterium]MBN2836411.1 30S ribosomal protein S4 [Candidatus Delongbacteria bacterium]
MARDFTPRGKICRKYGENLFGLPKFDRILQRKPYKPGQHGPMSKRGKLSEYAIQLREKQKAKYVYGLLEKQFRSVYDKAKKDTGITGENLIIRLECRLDTLVHRLGFAPSQRAARQMVSHKHVMVNGTNVNIPSFTVKPGDKIALRERSKKLEFIHESMKNISEAPLPYLRLDKANMVGELTEKPRREEIPVKINEQLIIELYSK